MADDDLLVHVHIPKTAGTALWDWFRRTQPDGHGLIYPKVPASYYLDENQFRQTGVFTTRARSLSSHYIRVFPARMLGRNLHYFTLLREPLGHFLSYCNYVRQVYRTIEDPELLASVPPDAGRLSAREFTAWILEQPNDVPFRENYQVNYLTSYVWRALARRGPRLGTPNPLWRDPDWSAYRKVRLDMAKDVLRAFASVGVVERMNDSLNLLARRAAAWGFELGSVEALQRENVTAEIEQDLSWIDDSDPVGSRLLESLEEDRELYAFANRLLDAGLRASP